MKELQFWQRIRLLCWALCVCFQFAWGQDTIPFYDEEKSIYLLRHLDICRTENMDRPGPGCEASIHDGRINLERLQLGESHWIRAKVVLPQDYRGVLALKAVGFRGAHEVYWDGELIQQNGTIGTERRRAQFGRYQFYSIIPAHLRQTGEHHLVVRHEKMAASQWRIARLLMGNYFDFRKRDRSGNHQMILMLTVFLTSAMFFLLFYFGFGKKIAFFFLSIYCMSYAIKTILKPYQDFFTPEFLIPYMSFENSHLAANFGSVFLIAFLLWEMSVPYRIWMLSGFALVSFLGYFAFTETEYLSLLMGCAGVAISYGIWKKVEGIGWTILGFVGFVVLILLWMENVLGYGYFAGVIFFLICMTFSVAQRIYRQIQLKQSALLRSSTLENQLLKKSIQPHFVLNSLASLQELIDQDPQGASDFVERLAEEFRMVSKVADQQLVSIQDEINLCRIHLKIMEYRKNSKFVLETQGLTGEEKIPPGIFHTLLENGITHGYAQKRTGRFLLEKLQLNKGAIEYRFFNDGEVESSEEGLLVKGTGLKYIEARLNGAYKDNWQLKSGRVENGWQVSIVIGGAFFDKVRLT